jgi:hypothetical protein
VLFDLSLETDSHSMLILVPGMQPCLGGDGKTLMFVNINSDPSSVKETLCSLRFAAKVNQCETGAKGGARKHITELPSGSDSAVTEPTAKEVKQQFVHACHSGQQSSVPRKWLARSTICVRKGVIKHKTACTIQRS